MEISMLAFQCCWMPSYETFIPVGHSALCWNSSLANAASLSHFVYFNSVCVTLDDKRKLIHNPSPTFLTPKKASSSNLCSLFNMIRMKRKMINHPWLWISKCPSHLLLLMPCIFLAKRGIRIAKCCWVKHSRNQRKVVLPKIGGI